MVAILLSTYNGEKYLESQIDSICNQTFKDWELYIRDDGSTDETIAIIENYSIKHDKIFFINDELSNLGPACSFLKLLKEIDSDYYMFCDQDDIWLPNKIEMMIDKIKNLELTNRDKPILICSDLTVVDNNLKVINDSFWNYSNITPKIIIQKYICVSNCVTGCTTLFNNLTKNFSLGFSSSTVITMHDYWVALCVFSNDGIIYPMEEKTVLYRQHNNNVYGAVYSAKDNFLKRLLLIRKNYHYNLNLFKMVHAKTNISLFSFIIKKISLFRLNRRNHI